MAIYKLGDLVKPQSLKRIYQKDWTNHGIPFLKVEDISKINDYSYKPKTYISKKLFLELKSKYKFPKIGSVLLTTGGSLGKVWVYDGRDCWFKDSAIRFFESDETKLLNKYLYFWFIKNNDIIGKTNNGSVMKIITSQIINSWLINLPSIKVQQQIIDIIEPFENIKINLINKLEKLNNISNILINKYNKKELMINNCSFIKGKTPATIDFVNYSEIPFINVSAINNNINKYLDQKKYSSNVNYGDVILSLDGTVGIVNNFIYGYNGYGYKVVSDNYENYKLYYSLKHTINQNIIINNTSGSVIKHASKSRNFLYVFWFENEYLLSICYKYEILIKKQILIVEKIINLLISSYII